MTDQTNDVINVISSYSTDTLVDSDGNILSTQEGGPMLYIKQALETTNTKYSLFNQSQPMEVEILVNEKGEFGKVKRQPLQKKLSDIEIGDWAIISTILDEWIIDEATVLPKKLFVDLQGYVRNGQDFGKKQIWSSAQELTGRIYCLKGTEEEVEYLPESVREEQKQMLLIVTKGERGADIYDRGKKFSVPTETVDGLTDTIGAGDTYLAHVVVSMHKGAIPFEAATYAANQTTQFLRQKAAKKL